MRQISILILGCVPLAVLTVESFRELAAVRDELAQPAPDDGSQAVARQCARCREQVAAEKPPCAAVLAADVFAGQSAVALQAVEVESPWKPAADRWFDWTRSRDLIAKVLEADQAATGGGVRELEAAVDRFETLHKRFSVLPPRGSPPVLKRVTQRITELGAKIDRIRSKDELDAILTRARAEFQEGHHPLVIALCDKLLAPAYHDAIEPEVAQKVRILKRRAQFSEDSERLPGRVRMADSDAAQAQILRAFIDKYSGAADLSPSEKRQLDDLRAQMQRLLAP
jgi:hypothetical protein